ncbi:MAG: phosphonate C-P lyase system protein PhnH [Hyphomicrobiaceae bacterium]|jgi:alpha-D-ribose 1-methylphosphonate 5-triphosphate synthase subunit PhnH
MPALPAPEPAFRDPVRQSQTVFRLVMEAMASPGRIVAVPSGLAPPAPLNGPAAALLLTLCDYETPVWLDEALDETTDVATFLRFHTGATLARSPSDAAFAAIAAAAAMPPLSFFAQGTPAYPDRSTTLIVQVETLANDGWRLEGPGIRGSARLRAAPLPADFVDRLRVNRAAFPCGVDIFFASDRTIAALPRSVRVSEAA